MMTRAYVLIDPKTGYVITDLSQAQRENEAEEAALFVTNGQSENKDTDEEEHRLPLATEYYDKEGRPIYKRFQRRPYGHSGR